MQSIAVAIKTIPDIEAGKRLYKINNLSNDGVAKAMFHLQQQKADSEILPHYLQQIITIAICYEEDGKIQTDILGDSDVSEKALLEQYVSLVKGKQQVTWNGTDFEFPILQYRALKNGVSFSGLSHQLDLSYKLSPSCSSEVPNLYEISCFLDLPDLQENNADTILDLWQGNDVDAIHSLAKHDAENVYRVFNRL